MKMDNGSFVDALSGVRVIDLTQLLQGPSATQLLGDFGADVIKIERIREGEIGRHQEPRVGGLATYFAAANRNKRSLSLNLKDPRAIEIVYRLAETADIVASNFRPGVMERLGLGHDRLTEVNPRIISAYASGYGQDGPYRDRRGQDLAAQAAGGLMAMTGSADGPPTPIGTFAVDYLASVQFAFGMMVALAARDRTGRGQIVDSCLLNAAVSMHLQEGTSFLSAGRTYPRPPEGIAHAHNTALYGTYRTSNGRWLALIAEFYVDEPWHRLCRALRIPDEVRFDPRFQTIEGLVAHQVESRSIVAEAFESLTFEEATEGLDKEDLLWASVNDHAELFNDPQVRHNGMILELEDPRIGRYRVVGTPIRLSDTPSRVRTTPPSVGQHNHEILNELGLSESEIRELQAEGVVGAENEESATTGRYRW